MEFGSKRIRGFTTGESGGLIMERIKTIAFYLPQFHEIPENNKFWGKGFTEWNNVRSAKPLFDGHDQPRVPENENYYNLEDVSVMKRQVSLAKDAGLYGFCFYHYWFKSKPVMSKPLDNYLKAMDINFPYCLCWANESWNNGWAKSDQKVILEQEYGDEEEWEKHFQFYLKFFKDERYIKENNKPFLVIYRPYSCEYMLDVLKYWNKRAVEEGFNGITYLSQRFEITNDKALYDYMNYHIEYEPGFVWSKAEYPENRISLKSRLHDAILRRTNVDISFLASGLKYRDYDLVWKRILELKPENEKSVAGAFVDWDNSPRHKERGVVCVGTTPEKFKRYISLQLEHIKREYTPQYMFIFAWNEWGEGGYLEPDVSHGHKYLDALHEAMYGEH